MPFAKGEEQKDEKEEISLCWLRRFVPSDFEDEQSELTNFEMAENNICFMANEAEVISESKNIVTVEELEDANEE